MVELSNVPITILVAKIISHSFSNDREPVSIHDVMLVRGHILKVPHQPDPFLASISFVVTVIYLVTLTLF